MSNPRAKARKITQATLLPALVLIWPLALFISFENVSAKTPPKRPLEFSFSKPHEKSWEHWVSQLHTRKAQEALPPRPDGKRFFMPLPLWVDCHLSWLFEKKSQLSLKINLPDSIVLESNRDQCSQQSELWAIKKF